MRQHHWWEGEGRAKRKKLRGERGQINEKERYGNMRKNGWIRDGEQSAELAIIREQNEIAYSLVTCRLQGTS